MSFSLQDVDFIGRMRQQSVRFPWGKHQLYRDFSPPDTQQQMLWHHVKEHGVSCMILHIRGPEWDADRQVPEGVSEDPIPAPGGNGAGQRGGPIIIRYFTT